MTNWKLSSRFLFSLLVPLVCEHRLFKDQHKSIPFVFQMLKQQLLD